MTRILFGVLLATMFALQANASAPQPGSPTATASTCTLVIHAIGFRNEKGGAGGAVFSSSDGWPEDLNKAYHHGDFPIKDGKSTLTFPMVPGKYGVVVIHDENLNHKMDRNIFGFPKEGYGFANNPHVGLTAPSVRTASVLVTCPLTETTIKIHYR
ncbi:MAG: DUF2141 domain-containing protein [Acidobacteriaceae bacterium]